MSIEMDYIRDNIRDVKQKVEAAAAKAGKNAGDIKIIAVTKTVDEIRIQKAIECGLKDIGENRVQELCDKYKKINKPCNWHLIGHLQTNKVKNIIDKVTMVHSLDRLELAEEIQKRAEKAGNVLETLVQVNIAEEETKFGLKKEKVYDFLREVCKFRNLKVRGLMTIAPFSQNPEEIRWVFTELRKLHIDISRENIDNIDMKYLSMGMSNDFDTAIEEGSNMVRIGTAIFGKRI